MEQRLSRFAGQGFWSGGFWGRVGTVPRADEVGIVHQLPTSGTEIEADEFGGLGLLRVVGLGGDLFGQQLLHDGGSEVGDGGETAFTIDELPGAFMAGMRARA